MEGFFSIKETVSTSRPDGKLHTCISCGLFKGCTTPKFAFSGNFKAGIMNLCTMPTDEEDRQGEGFISREAKYLARTYKEHGIDLHEDCLNGYVVRCNTDKAPTSVHIASCRRGIMAAIKKYKPKVVVLFGEDALKSVIGARWAKDLGTINKWRGWAIPDQTLGCFLMPMYAPENVVGNKDKSFETIFRQDLSKVKETAERTFPKHKEPEIVYTDDLSFLSNISRGRTVSFDYETTGLKPHAEGHRIVCCSVAVTSDKVYTFMIPEDEKGRRPLQKFLRNPSVYKSAQNMKFEHAWSKVRLGVDVKGWRYDTMLANHIIDNREGVTGLKFQTYVQFGVIDYDSEISPYLKSKDNKNANAINQIDKLLEMPGGKEKLLRYCALDSIYEHRLMEMTITPMLSVAGLSEISPPLSAFPHAYKLLHEGTLALAKAEQQGLRIDLNYVDRVKARLSRKIEILEKKIYESKFYRHWQHCSKGKVNLSSGIQLGNYLYGVKNLQPRKLTETGKGSTDEEALAMLGIEELDWILQRSKLMKLRDTYLSAFEREQVDGVLRPFFNLNVAVTYRSSSSNPNFQNIPKRDQESMQTIRKAIYPRRGHQLLEMDFSGIEVAIAAAYHKDPMMLSYITDPTTDMHGDMAAQIFLIDDFHKKQKDHALLRSCCKNSFVFPQFYGDYYKNCAQNICNNWIHMPTNGRWSKGMGVKMLDGSTIASHLMDKGIRSYEAFESHIREIEEHFWNKRFPVYAKWKETHYENYLERGYIKMFTGFVCKGAMRRNNISNYPVQGAAFHCLLYTFIEVTKELERRGMDTKLVGQIHDAIVFDVHPDELLEVHEIVQYAGTQKIKEDWKWINVPLQLESELCPVDRSWAEKEDWKP
jgi:DNA polymerase I